ncbi:MAG: hypothetical protein M1830_009614 [Pleopsidium flavum]|nr:MAG: hypothetical protein M1830_009614 [Pleopsidium flavum]
MVKKRASKYDVNLVFAEQKLTDMAQRSQQERSGSRQADTLLQLLEMYAKGQGNQEIHNPQHG